MAHAKDTFDSLHFDNHFLIALENDCLTFCDIEMGKLNFEPSGAQRNVRFQLKTKQDLPD